MRRTTLLILLLAVVFVVAVVFVARRTSDRSGSSTLAWTDIDDGIDAARAQGKIVLVDVYTDWCTWCKQMDKRTYADNDVAAMINRSFVPVKLNAESQVIRRFRSGGVSDAGIAQQFGVSGYPTTVFLSPDGSVITSLDGFMQPGQFRAVLERVIATRQ